MGSMFNMAQKAGYCPSMFDHYFEWKVLGSPPRPAHAEARNRGAQLKVQCLTRMKEKADAYEVHVSFRILFMSHSTSVPYRTWSVLET